MERIFSKGSGNSWYYDYLCNSSGTIEFTHVWANDSLNNWNNTSVSGISFICDLDNPVISNPAANVSSIDRDDFFCINVTVTDTATQRYFAGIKYQKLRLFQLSILWRASIASHEFFSNVHLDSLRNNMLRQMIENEQPGKSTQYGCRMTIFYDDVDENLNKRLDTILSSPGCYGLKPSPIIGQSWQIYSFFFGGYGWDFYVANKKITSEPS